MRSVTEKFKDDLEHKRDTRHYKTVQKYAFLGLAHILRKML